MKTSTLTKLLLLPIAASFVLQACGSSSSSKKLRGRLSFDITDINFVYPTDQSSNVPLNVTFQMQFPGTSAICDQPEAVSEIVGVKKANAAYDDLDLQGSARVKLAEGYKPASRQPADGSYCEIWARLDRSVNADFLDPNTRYIAGVVDESAGDTRLKKKSVEFVTGTQIPTFQFNSAVLQPNKWQQLTDFDPVAGFNNIGGEDFDWNDAFNDYLTINGRAIGTYLLSVITGLGTMSPSYGTKMEFSEPLDPYDFRNYIKLIKLATVQEILNRDFDFRSLQVFSDSDLSGCSNPYSPSDPRYATYNGSCLYFLPADPSNETAFIQGPDGGCLEPNTAYAVAISGAMLSSHGAILDTSFIHYFVTNGNSCN